MSANHGPERVGATWPTHPKAAEPSPTEESGPSARRPLALDREGNGPAGEAAPLEAAPPTVEADGPPGQPELPDGAFWPTVPGYEILGELGRGGMGVVYKARQLGLNRVVALKVIRAGSHASAADRARFRTEAEVVGRLRHPGIVQVYEVGEHQGLPFLSLEFCPGGSLAARLGGTPQPPRQAARVAVALARAVQAAHDSDVVHRDLKPGNVLLGSAAGAEPVAPESLKVTDFGLAKLLGSASQTLSNAVVGTPCYMAPEQAARRHREVGPAADVYALGAILYELLTGRPPFLAETPLDTLLQVLEDEPIPPTRLQRKTPRDIETICLKCLQKETRKRYAAAADLADDLSRFLGGEPIRARPVRAWERGAKWARRKPALAGLFAVVTLALSGLVAGLLVYQETRARMAERELRDRRRYDEVRQLVLEGQQAVVRREWERAQDRLTLALAKVGPDDPFLDDLRDQANELLAQTRRGMSAITARKAAVAAHDQFRKRREEALFHATLATGAGLAANLKATRGAAEAALALGKVTPEGGYGPLVLDAPFTAEEKVELRDGVYELLLVLAEVELDAGLAGKGAEHLGRAGRALDCAHALEHPAHPTQAYLLRRARHLELLGNPKEAASTRSQAARRPPRTALDRYLVGCERYKQGDVAGAVREFERVVEMQPDHTWARYFLSVGYLALGRAADARAALTVCLAQRRDFGWAYLLRGFTHGQLGDFQAGADDFERALGLSQDDDARHVLYANRGVLWFQQGKLEEAAADLSRAIGLKPREHQAYVTLAQIYQKQGKRREALAQLDRAIGLEAGLASLYRLRARLHQEGEDLPAALRDADHVLRLDLKNAAPRPTLAKDQVQRGHILFRLGDNAKALAAYDEALQLDPAYALPHLLRADVYLKARDYGEVEYSLSRYLAKGGPPTAEVYRARGLARARLGDYARAAEDFGRAIERKSGDSATHAARGWALLACAAHRLAEVDFSEAIRLDPKNADAHKGRGFTRAAVGNHLGAVKDVEAALRLVPNNLALLQDAARVFAQVVGQLERPDRKQGPGDPALCDQYRKRAVELLRRALQLTPAAQRRRFWEQRVEPDKALEPIRGSPEYQGLKRVTGG